MRKIFLLMLLHCFFICSLQVQAAEVGYAVKMAFSELSRLRLLCLLNGSYEEYIEGLSKAQKQFELVQEQSYAVEHLKAALSNYAQALRMWQFNNSAMFIDASRRSDEDIATKCTEAVGGLNSPSVRTAISCFWYKAAEELDEVPSLIQEGK